MKTILLLILSIALASAAEKLPNILFISIDDQNDWIGHQGGHPLAKTPHIDALAARGTTFLNAHCQAPICNPSRTSVLFGLRPSTTGIYGLAPPPRAHVWGQSSVWGQSFRIDISTLADCLGSVLSD